MGIFYDKIESGKGAVRYEFVKKLYLVCNAHLDPVWQWTWEEGAAETLATFKSAADLCEEYDYIFCHNEEWIYEFVEEYDPILFERIVKLAQEGKWRIMGGWFLQPDVLLPAGESLIRQIQYGKKYFSEKFGYFPKTAIGFDAFGHSRGLVQIMKKCGQDSYIVVRPQKNLLELPNDYFIWEGYDGSEIKTIRCPSYNTFLGRALEQTQKYVEDYKSVETGVMLWGVGNHGGGPSRKDLSDFKTFMENGDMEVKHSYPEEVFENLKFSVRYDKSLITCMPGCYTALNRMKQKYIRLENMLYETEKMASQTYLENKDYVYPEEKLFDVCKQMLKIQFHDILSGTVIKSGEKGALRVLENAYYTLEEIRANCFFFLLRNVERSAPGEYCICVYNAFPYEREENVEFEFTMEKNSNTALKPKITLYDENDKIIPIQVIKEESNVSIDCRKKIVFNYKLKAFSINRFRVTTELIENDYAKMDSNALEISTPYYQVIIDPTSGGISQFFVNGENYISRKGFGLYVYEDNEDPWGMGEEQLQSMGGFYSRIMLDQRPDGLFAGLKNLRVIEDGSIQKTVEALYIQKQNSFVVDYVFYKNRPYFDVKLKVFWNDKNKMLKLHIPVANEGHFIGQQVFGQERLYKDGKECVAQKFVSYGNGQKRFAILNNSSYGCSFENNVIKLSLLRGATYCAHPVDDMPIISYEKYIDVTDLGENEFSFRMGVFDNDALEKEAIEFSQPSYALSVGPTGGNYEKPVDRKVILSNPNISLVTMKKQYGKDSMIIRLFNNSKENAETELKIGESVKCVSFGRFEVKTLIYERGNIAESYETII